MKRFLFLLFFSLVFCLPNSSSVSFHQEYISISTYEQNKKIPPNLSSHQFIGWGNKAINRTTVAPKRKITIAVIDSGIDTDHKDLIDVVTKEYNAINEEEKIQDDTGHGTAMAGIIAALDNNHGVIGAASNEMVEIYSIKAFQNNTSNNHYIYKAMKWAIDNDVDIINMSLGSDQADGKIKELIDQAYNRNIFIIAAAGNKVNGKVDFPASEDKVISVGAITHEMKKVTFTAYGKIDFVGPGDRILTTSPNHTYSFTSHTSAAAAFVSGVFANYLCTFTSKNDYQWEEIKEYFAQKAIDLGDKELFGHGLIQN